MVSFKVNNRQVTFDGDEETPLLWVLRDHIKLTGAKFSCGMGLCGAGVIESHPHTVPISKESPNYWRM